MAFVSGGFRSWNSRKLKGKKKKKREKMQVIQELGTNCIKKIENL
jgi:hypothetical protein